MRRRRDRMPVPEPVVDETTGRVEAVLGSAVRGDRPGRVTLDDMARKIAEHNRKLAGGTFLGMSREGWARTIVAWVAGAILAIGAAWLSLRDTVAASASRSWVEEAIETHRTVETHVVTESDLDAIRAEQRTIRESQIRQEEAAKATAEVLSEIKVELRRARRRR